MPTRILCRMVYSLFVRDSADIRRENYIVDTELPKADPVAYVFPVMLEYILIHAPTISMCRYRITET